MKTLKSSLIVWLRGAVLVWPLAAATLVQAATVWNGTPISFSHTPENGLEDQLTPTVAFNRSGSGGLYNSVTEGGATSGISPDDTEWAIGSLASYNSLSYGPCPLEQGNNPAHYIGTTFIVHLKSDDIYFSLTLMDWGGQGGNGNTTFGYTRTTAGAPAPAVTITNPVTGAVFAGPATVTFKANATVSSGTVTNVQFFTNNVSFRSVQSVPFNVTATNLPAGAYALKAVATAAGISATSAVVNVSVVSPVTVNLSAAGLVNGKFSFNYAANAGLTYVVESSTNLLNWTPLVTNVAGVNPAPFTNAVNATGIQFYRVGRLPNP